MSLEKILEYQEIDQKIYREELNLRRSAEAQRINSLINQINAAQQNLIKLDKDAEDLFSEIENIERRLDEIASQEKGYSYSGINSLNQLESMEKTLMSASEEINNLERETKRAFKRLADINGEAGKQYETGMSMKKELNKVKADYNEKLEELRTKYKQQNEALNELKKDIPPEMLKVYKNLRDNRKMPAFVPYESGNCSACGMLIQVEVEAKLKSSGDTAECPNCRRIVYMK